MRGPETFELKHSANKVLLIFIIKPSKTGSDGRSYLKQMKYREGMCLVLCLIIFGHVKATRHKIKVIGI